MKKYTSSLIGALDKCILVSIPEDQLEIMVAQLCALTALCGILAAVSKLALGNGGLEPTVKANIFNYWKSEKPGSELLRALQLLQRLVFGGKIYRSLETCNCGDMAVYYL